MVDVLFTYLIRPVYMEKSCLPAVSTLASVYMRKKLTPLPESRAGPSWLYNDNSARAHSDLLALTKLTRLDDSKCLYRKRVTQLGGSPFWPSQLFVSHVSGSSTFVRQCRESLLAQGSSGQLFSIKKGPSGNHLGKFACNSCTSDTPPE